MFDFLSFCEGGLICGLAAMLFFVVISMDNPRIQKKLEERKIAKNILGQDKKVEIIKRQEDIDEILKK